MIVLKMYFHLLELLSSHNTFTVLGSQLRYQFELSPLFLLAILNLRFTEPRTESLVLQGWGWCKVLFFVFCFFFFFFFIPFASGGALGWDLFFSF